MDPEAEELPRFTSLDEDLGAGEAWAMVERSVYEPLGYAMKMRDLLSLVRVLSSPQRELLVAACQELEHG